LNPGLIFAMPKAMAHIFYILRGIFSISGVIGHYQGYNRDSRLLKVKG